MRGLDGYRGARRVQVLAALWVVLAASYLLPFARPAEASVTFTVNSSVDAPDADPGDGICATADGTCTLRAAVQEADSLATPTVIVLTSDLYTLSLGQLTISAAATIDGNGSYIDGNSASRVVATSSGDPGVTINDLTIRNGRVTGDGGGIENSGTLSLVGVSLDGNSASGKGGGVDNAGTLTVSGGSIAGNTAGTQGGAFANSSSASFSGTAFSGNSAGGCAGGFNTGTLTLTETTWTGNASTNSQTLSCGGLGNVGAGASATITDAIFGGNGVGNGGGDQGGAVYDSDGSVTVSRAFIGENSSVYGGGVSSAGKATVQLTNVTMDANAAAYGSALYAGSGSTIRVLNATIDQNLQTHKESFFPMGSVFGEDRVEPGGSVVAKNSILGQGWYCPPGSACQPTPSCSGSVISLGHNLDTDDSCGLQGSGDLVNSNAGLAQDPGSNGGFVPTWALRPGSAAVNGGTETGCPATDARGDPRPVGASCDIGAFELSADLGASIDAPAFVTVGGIIAYKVTITDHGPDPASNVTLADHLPSAVSLFSTDPPCSFSGQDVTCSLGGSLGSGSSITETIRVSANQTGSVSNSVTVSSASPSTPDPNPSNNSPSATTEVHPPQTLSVSKTGSGTGSVSSSPTGISCGATCQASFDYDAQVTLTPQADAGSAFAGWVGDCSGTGTCQVTMTQARSVTATFSDTTAPAVTLTSPANNGLTNSSAPTFSGAAGTATGDSSTVTVKVYAGANNTKPANLVQTQIATASGGSWSVAASPALADGTYSVQASQSDAAGNIGRSSIATFTVDTVPPPAPSIGTHPVDPTNATSASFGFSDSEGGASFTCQLDAGGFLACASPKAYSALSDGSHTFQVKAQDAAGNVSGATSFTWTVDTTPPPTPSIDSRPRALTNKTSARFTFSDADSTAAFQCSLDGGAFAPCVSPAIYRDLSEGKHTFSVRAVDAAGNGSPATVATWRIDLTPPETTITSGPSGTVSSRTATFKFASSERNSTFLCSRDGGAYKACTSPKSFTGLKDGPHAFRVKARDAAGNLDPTPAVRKWAVAGGTWLRQLHQLSG